LDILINPTEENAKRVYKSICEFFGVDKLEEGDYKIFTKKYPEGCFAYGLGVVPNCIEIFTNLPGIKFSKSWENRVKAKYGEIDIWIISQRDLEHNFKIVSKRSPSLAKKYGYFLTELKRYEKKKY